MSKSEPNVSVTRAWMELIRLPNLFTVPGDVLAGAFFAAGLAGAFPGALPLALAAAAAVAVYAAGLIDNDLVDEAEDARERPARPLPSRRVSRASAVGARAALFLVPFILALSGLMPHPWILAMALLVAAVLIYNRVKSRIPVLGFLLMGLCRGVNLLAGVLLVDHPERVMAATAGLAACWVLYVTGLTVFASHETRCAPGSCRFLVALPAAALALVAWIPNLSWRAVVSLTVAGWAGTLGAIEAFCQCPPGPRPVRVPGTVGRLVRLLIPMQALLCMSAPGFTKVAIAVSGLLVCWVLAEWLGRRFYAS